MEGNEPAYDLELLQRRIGQGPLTSFITRTAVDGATELDLETDDIVSAVLGLERSNFYKSMESVRFPELHQDVYHVEYRGRQIYVKLQLLPDGRAAVVQFKRK